MGTRSIAQRFGRRIAKLRQQVRIWRGFALPGLVIVGLIVLVRLAGFLQAQEWMAFDHLLRLRPAENTDVRVTIVGIDDPDLSAVGGFPVADRALAQALAILQESQPRVIGLDLFREHKGTPDRDLLGRILRNSPNLIGVEVALNQTESFNVKPPPELPSDRVGFADLIVDPDGKLRRALLASRTWEGALKYSFPLCLARLYLQTEGISFDHGIRNASHPPKSTDPIQFGSMPVPRFYPNSGGYVNADANGNQVLLNFRNDQQPFRVLSLTDILQRNFDPNWIRDRLVIVGMTAARVKDTFITSAVPNTLYSIQLDGGASVSNQLIYGVEIHAHTTSQLLSSVLDGRSPIEIWWDFWEYLWIVSWGMLGISLGIMLRSPWKTILCLSLMSLGLWGLCYGLLTQGWWVPLVPTAIALWGAGLTTATIERDFRFELEQRRQTIERSYEAVHNGPLQHLAALLRNIGEEELPPEQLRERLQTLNQELRGIYESMRADLVTRRDTLYLKGSTVLDLQTPLPELLYQVYDHTLNRDFPGFATIMTYISPDFAPLETCLLSIEQKRGLCLFLEEALCNVGKHALGTTRLDVACTYQAGWYRIQIIDNGQSVPSSRNLEITGQGTHQAQALAQQLKGQFQRYPNFPDGIVCELSWMAFGSWSRRLWSVLLSRFGKN
jgi:CHASE2 domain-containing sensor protein